MSGEFLNTIKEIKDNLPVIRTANSLFSDDMTSVLRELVDLDIALITEDLIKSNYLGNRKIDIDFALNNTSTTNEVTYKGVTLTLNNGVSLQIDFTSLNELQEPVVEELASYASIYNRLITGIATYNAGEVNPQLHIVNTEIDVINDTLPNLPTMIRVRDVDGFASNIDRIQFQVYSGSAIEANPAYFWAKTTSALQTLANRVGDIIALGNDIQSIIALADKEDEIQYLFDNKESLTGVNSLYSELSKIQAIHSNLIGLVAIYNDIKAGGTNKINTVAESVYKAEIAIVAESIYKAQVVAVAEIKTSVENVAANKTHIDAVAANKTNIDALYAKLSDIAVIVTNITEILAADENAVIATNKASEASGYANTAKGYRDQLTNLTVEALTLAAGQLATVSYSTTTNKLTLGLPAGAKGDKGDPFLVNSVGAFADRALYNAQVKGFSFLAMDTATIYFKLSATSGDWSTGAPFGRGEKGDTGVGIAGIVKTATNGNIDTYTITYTNGATSTYEVANGAVTSVNGRLGAITLTKSDVGLANADNTSDANKPISDAQAAVNIAKINISDIQDILTSTDTSKPLSAKQGKVLKGLIDNLVALLGSNDVNLDTLQEIVSFIKLNKTTLDSLGVANIIGLADALTLKADKSTTYTKTESDASLLTLNSKIYFIGGM